MWSLEKGKFSSFEGMSEILKSVMNINFNKDPFVLGLRHKIRKNDYSSIFEYGGITLAVMIIVFVGLKKLGGGGNLTEGMFSGGD